MSKIHLKTWLLCAASALALAACGGDGGDGVNNAGGGGGSTPPPDPTPLENPAVPASAGASSQGFLAYIASLANFMWDTTEPRDLSNFTPPSENVDSQEPIATSNDAA